MPPRLERCAACRFWERGREEDAPAAWGNCHRHAPPAVVAWDGKFPLDAWWPITTDDDFCGEWAPLPVPRGGPPI